MSTYHQIWHFTNSKDNSTYQEPYSHFTLRTLSPLVIVEVEAWAEDLDFEELTQEGAQEETEHSGFCEGVGVASDGEGVGVWVPRGAEYLEAEVLRGGMRLIDTQELIESKGQAKGHNQAQGQNCY